MTTQLLDSEIVYCRASRDYDILIAGVICASAATYGQAEAIRTRLLAERRDEGHYATATALDGTLEQAAALDQFQAELLADLSAIPEDTDPEDFSDVGARAVSWGDDPSPVSDDGCGFVIAQLAVSAALLLLTLRAVMLRRKPRRRPDPTRPAAILDRRITHYVADVPQYEAEARCDDGKVRAFVSGPDGRWVRRA